MTTTQTEPIGEDWITAQLDQHRNGPTHATAADVNERLGHMQVTDIEARLVPFLAAAAAELAHVSGIRWVFRTDDPPVALLRMIAKVGILEPSAGGPHTDRLLAQLA